MEIGRIYKILLLVFIVLLVYFPAISNPICPIDDTFIVNAFGVNGNKSLLDVFSPSIGFYYRPLVNFTYLIDRDLWGLNAGFMHLENIILHALNTILVFFLASKVSQRAPLPVPHLPLLSALVFALHPINTEPVNWIAGRTDPLAASFVFIATYFLLKSIIQNSHKYEFISIAMMMLGALSKETAIMSIPAGFLLALRLPAASHETPDLPKYESRKALFLLMLVSVTIFMIFLIHLLIRNSHNSLSMLLSGSGHTFTDALAGGFEAIGFYVRKLFLPLPLNFAIVNISSQYIWLGIIVVATQVIYIRRKNIFALFFTIGLFFIIPAIVVALKKIAWTPYAERYLYIPSAFFSIAFVGFIYMFFHKIRKRSCVVPVSIFVILPAAFFTLHRIHVWQDNLKLMQDCVDKSPSFGVVRNELALALIRDGREDEAAKHLMIAQKLQNTDEVNRIIMLNQLGRNLRNRTSEEARVILLEFMKDKQSADVELLKLLNRYDEYMLAKASDNSTQRKMAQEIMDTNLLLFRNTGDPYCLYRNGQLALLVGDKKKAAGFFSKCVEQAPSDAYYRDSASKLAAKLGR